MSVNVGIQLSHNGAYSGEYTQYVADYAQTNITISSPVDIPAYGLINVTIKNMSGTVPQSDPALNRIACSLEAMQNHIGALITAQQEEIAFWRAKASLLESELYRSSANG